MYNCFFIISKCGLTFKFSLCFNPYKYAQEQYKKVGHKAPASKHWFNHIEWFHIDHIEIHDQDTKDAWFVFCEFMLVAVNKNWKNKQTRSNAYVSDVCTASDEAFAMVIGLTNMENWIKKLQTTKNSKVKEIVAGKPPDEVEGDGENDQDEQEDNEDDALEDQVEEKPKDKIDKNKYYELMQLLQLSKRVNYRHFMSWDEAFQEHISISLATPSSKASSTTKGTNEEASKERDFPKVDFEKW
jgi:hypothetical protein